MPDDKITPEEKLTNTTNSTEQLISDQSAGVSPKASHAGAVSRGGVKRLSAVIPFRSLFNLKTGNKILAGLCSIGSLIVTVVFLQGARSLEDRVDTALRVPSSGEHLMDEKEAVRCNAKAILHSAHKRNMFTFAARNVAQKHTEEQRQTVDDCSLVGILWSDNPQAMIEVKKEGKTYLVSAGERVGVFQVKEVARNHVVLTEDTEEWILR